MRRWVSYNSSFNQPADSVVVQLSQVYVARPVQRRAVKTRLNSVRRSSLVEIRLVLRCEFGFSYLDRLRSFFLTHGENHYAEHVVEVDLQFSEICLNCTFPLGLLACGNAQGDILLYSVKPVISNRKNDACGFLAPSRVSISSFC